MTRKFALGRDICTMHLPQVLSSYVYSFESYHVDKQTNKQTNAPTNKQTPLKTANALRYDTTLGNNTSIPWAVRLSWLENAYSRSLFGR